MGKSSSKKRAQRNITIEPEMEEALDRVTESFPGSQLSLLSHVVNWFLSLPPEKQRDIVMPLPASEALSHTPGRKGDPGHTKPSVIAGKTAVLIVASALIAAPGPGRDNAWPHSPSYTTIVGASSRRQTQRNESGDE